MVLRSVCRPLATAVLCVTATAATAQTRLTVEEIYGYEGWKRLNGSQAAMMTWTPAGDPWLSDRDHLWPAQSEAEGRVEGPAAAARGCALMRCPAQPALYTYAQLERALAGAAWRCRGGIASRSRLDFQCRARCLPHRDGDDLYGTRS